jgi:uncharacterized membrane protein YqgA involved in biofilm formation
MMELFARTSGTWINIAAVAIGTAVGVLGGARLPERLGRTLMQVLGLVTLFVGLGMARMLDGVRSGPLPGVIVALVSLALGALAGEALGIEERLTAFGEAARHRLGGGGRFTEGFVTASLLFCIGPMAIVGSLQNGLALDARTLVLKSTLDAGALARVLPDPATDPRVLVVSGAGGLMVAGIGVNLLLAGLGLEDRKLRLGSMLPALVIAPLLHALAS